MAKTHSNKGRPRLVTYDSSANRVADTGFTQEDVHHVLGWDGDTMYLLTAVSAAGVGTWTDLQSTNSTADAQTVVGGAIVQGAMTITASEVITISTVDTDTLVTFENDVAASQGCTVDSTTDNDITITNDCMCLLYFTYTMSGTASKAYDIHISVGGTPVMTKSLLVPATGTLADTIMIPRVMTAADVVTAEVACTTDDSDATFTESVLGVFGMRDFS